MEEPLRALKALSDKSKRSVGCPGSPSLLAHCRAFSRLVPEEDLPEAPHPALRDSRQNGHRARLFR